MRDPGGHNNIRTWHCAGSLSPEVKGKGVTRGANKGQAPVHFLCHSCFAFRESSTSSALLGKGTEKKVEKKETTAQEMFHTHTQIMLVHRLCRCWFSGQHKPCRNLAVAAWHQCHRSYDMHFGHADRCMQTDMHACMYPVACLVTQPSLHAAQNWVCIMHVVSTVMYMAKLDACSLRLGQWF